MRSKLLFALLIGVLAMLAVSSVGAQAGAVPLCPDVGGSTSEIVRAAVQPGTVTNGTVYCRILAQDGGFLRSAAEIPDPGVLNLGVVQVVDVFGMENGGRWVTTFNSPVQVCLRGSGTYLFMDARQSPRLASTIAASASDGYVCATLSGPGTVALVSGSVGQPAQPAGPAPVLPTAPGPAVITGTPAPLPTLEAGVVVDLLDRNCTGRTTRIVRLRAEPNTTSSIIATLPYNLSLRMTGATQGWYRVVYLNGQGWVSADFFRPVAGCRF